MEEPGSPAQRRYTPIQIGVATFLGGPLSGCWFISRIQTAAGDDISARRWVIGGVVGTLALLVLAYLLPDRLMTQAIPIGCTIGLYQSAAKLFGASLENHFAAGGRKGSWWIVLGVSILCLVLIVTLVFLVEFSLKTSNSAQMITGDF